jgi:uncharacterized peroxidase-related enzyme
MPRIQPVERAQASTTVQAQYDVAQAALGGVPNLIKTFGNSEHALGAFLNLYAATSATNLSAQLREQIALAVAETNGCHYCLSAHSAIGRKLGLERAEIDAARRGSAAEAKANAAVKFAKAVSEKRGRVSDAELAELRLAGYSDKEAVEIVAVVVLNVFTNFLNNVADTEIDFPRAAPLSDAA